ncbi:hypothetical protein [Geomonas oryzae]|uniref:hypothetical protein n=1 Tax=Geomonas oryzae TaxID=2364273 RepID=UPI00100C17A8|nr:hypothetical protein [Geomonas oryzae]
MARQQLQKLSQRICNAAEAFLRDPAEDEGFQPTDAPREVFTTNTEIPALHHAIMDLQEDRKESLLSIFKTHLEGEGPLGKAEYLFMIYEIQRASYFKRRIPRRRFIELLQLHKELYRLYHSHFPDDHYLLSNLNAYAVSTGINNHVPTALEKMLAMAEKAPETKSYNPDLMVRNLAALFRESDMVSEVPFSSTLSGYDETLITLAAGGVFEEGRGSSERFLKYLEQPVDLTEKGAQFRLQVVSNDTGFWAVLELNNLVMPLEYRQFCELSSLDNLEPPVLQTTDDFLILRLPHGCRLFLSPEEADTLKEACSRIKSDPGYRSHDRIWSVLHGIWS